MAKYTEKQLLHLAGKLAVTCQRVINSNAVNVSEAIREMSKALIEYNNAIYSNLE